MHHTQQTHDVGTQRSLYHQTHFTPLHPILCSRLTSVIVGSKHDEGVTANRITTVQITTLQITNLQITALQITTLQITTVQIRERTNCMHRNRGNLTVGLKNETVEIVRIIFPRPQPQNLRFWE
jgi:hypothetical protein